MIESRQIKGECEGDSAGPEERLVRESRDARRVPSFGRVITFASAVIFVLFLWSQSYNKLSNLYDYSVLAYGSAFLHRGMMPYRDFGTAIQTMPYFMAFVWEKIFGPRYLSLAYGNLILTVALLIAVFAMTRMVIGYYAALFFAVSVCSASTLQHGIFWYNPLGLFWLMLILLIGFVVVKRNALRRSDLLLFALILCCTGMTKLNYHAAAIGIVLFYLCCLYARRSLSGGRLVLIILCLVCIAVFVPVLIELLITGTTLHEWVRDVLVLPSARAGNLVLLRHRQFWFGTVYTYYKGNPFRYVYAVSGVMFILLSGTLLWRSKLNFNRARQWIGYLTPLAAIWFFFLMSVLLAITNTDMPSIAESVLPIGLLAVCLAFDGDLSKIAKGALKAASIVLAAGLLCLSIVAISKHARLVYADDLPNPRFPIKITSPGYLNGVSLTEASYEKLQDAAAVIAKFGITRDSNEVYWGPGTEMFCRQFETKPQQGFPFYADTTIAASDYAAAIARLQASRVRVFVVETYLEQWFLPAAIQNYLTNRWRPISVGLLKCYVRD